MSIIGIAGTFGGGIGMKLMGKRKLYLISILGVTCSSLTLCEYLSSSLRENRFKISLKHFFKQKFNYSKLFLAIYGFLYLPPNSKSYVMKANPTKSEQLIVPLIVFCVMRFFTTITLLVRNDWCNLFILIRSTTNNWLCFRSRMRCSVSYFQWKLVAWPQD